MILPSLHDVLRNTEEYTSMDIRIYSFTKKGSQLNRMLEEAFLKEGASCEGYAVERFAKEFALKPAGEKIQRQIGGIWGKKSLIFVGAVGIAVRMIAPWVKDKYTDSAVVTVDEEGRFVIPLLSGHLGGAAALAEKVAKKTKGTLVLTAATDVQRKFAVDLFAAKNHLKIQDREAAKQISAAVLEGKKIGLYSGQPVYGTAPENVSVCGSREELDAYDYKVAIGGDIDSIGKKQKEEKQETIYLELLPQNVVIGIGCRKGTSKEKIKTELENILTGQGLDKSRVEAFVSIDMKKNEPGILEVAEEYGVPFITFSAEELRTVEKVSCGSQFVEQVTGVDNVCERSVKLFCPEGELLLPKICGDGVTFAAACRRKKISF